MTRGQYLAMCCIGAVAVIAFLQTVQLTKRLSGGGVVARDTSPVIA